MPIRAARPSDIPRRAAFRESAFRAPLALDPGPGLLADVLRGHTPQPGAFDLFFDCGNPCMFDPAAVTDGVAVLHVDGPLEDRASWLWSSYEGIIEAATLATECEAVRATVLRLKSPGGEAAGMPEVHTALRRLATQKPIYAWCQQACSAAYNLASACSEVWVPEDGDVGSIGVILCTVDETARLEKEGIAVRYVVTGARKADMHPGTAITADVLREAQSKVDRLGELFFRAVGSARGLKPAYVEALEAASFLGSDAVEIGLADGVAGWADFLGYVRGSLGATVVPPRTAQTVPAAQPPAP